MNRAFAIHTIVFDILSPGFAFNIDENAGRWLGKVNKNKWRQIAGLVGEWEILEWNTLAWVIFDWSNVLTISRILWGESRKKTTINDNS